MISRLIFLLTLLLASASFADPTGLWNTIDDKTKKVKSTVEVYLKDGKLYAKIIDLSDPDVPNPVCEKCSGELEGAPIIGMVIVNGLSKDGDYWKGGEILDPEKGDWYNCKIWEEGDKLKVKGNVMFISRTQTWVRPQS